MRNFRTWDIFKDGMNFVKEIYLLTKELPKDEIHELNSQIRRAAISIVNNIAEGSAKTSSKDFKRFFEYKNTKELAKQLTDINDLIKITRDKITGYKNHVAKFDITTNGSETEIFYRDFVGTYST